jgi:hypothetical protein
MNLILAPYFIGKDDPQKDVRDPNEILGYDGNRFVESYYNMKRWYDSVCRLGLHGVIFHDCLSNSFVDQYENDNVQFERVILGDRSTNDERFFVYLDYLKVTACDFVYMTDLFDVEFKQEPFSIIGNHLVYSGSEECVNSENNWMRYKYNEVYGINVDDYPEIANRRVMNPGIIGGLRENMIILLDKMCEGMSKKPRNVNSNLVVYNEALFRMFRMNDIYTGGKLHSRYKYNEDRGDVCVIHK